MSEWGGGAEGLGAARGVEGSFGRWGCGGVRGGNNRAWAGGWGGGFGGGGSGGAERSPRPLTGSGSELRVRPPH